MFKTLFQNILTEKFKELKSLVYNYRDLKEKEISELSPENLKRARNFKECVIELVGPTLQDIFFPLRPIGC